MLDSKDAILRAVENFPRWMDIRKRLKTSVGGKYLLSLVEEQNEIKKSYEDFKKSFFLDTYVGKEDDIICQVYVAQIGKLSNILSKDDRYQITTDAKTFAENTSKYALYQDDYIILSPVNVDPSNPVLFYEYEGRTFSATLKKKDLWNIFDEFALFSGIERYEGEKNSELVKRIFAAFKKPTNATEKGLKNAIINAVMNVSTITADEIKLEVPNGSNMHLIASGDQSIYDKMSEINKDIAREKVWDHCYWQNDFKKLSYIPNVWDKPIHGHQHGVGQREDLKTILSSDQLNGENTNLEIYGYTASTKLINEYVRRQNLKKNIQLQLLRYKNELVPRTVIYRIGATQAEKFDPSRVYINGIQHSRGKTTVPISDILVDKTTATEVKRGSIEREKSYTLKFRSRTAYDNMIIEKCEMVNSGGEKTSLLVSQPGFSLDDGIVKNSDVKFHESSVSRLSSLKNIVNYPTGGITIGDDGIRGSFMIPVSGMDNMPVMTEIENKRTDYTNNTEFVKLLGNFMYNDDHTEITCTSSATDNQVVIDMNCAEIEYELAKASTPSSQGTISVTVEVDGQVSTQHSGLKTEGKKYEIKFGNSHKIKITITKVGVNPVTIKNIMAARYRVTYALTASDVIKVGDYVRLPQNIPQGTMMQVTLESFGTYAPVMKYIHVGPSVENAVYQLRKINPGDNVAFNIKTNCRVELYESVGGQENLINSDYNTLPLYRNDTGEIIGIYINTDEFVSIESSSRQIYSGAYNGKIARYINLAPGEQLDSITITGERKVVKSRVQLNSLTGNNGELYVAGNIDGIVSLKNKETALIKIPRDRLDRTADKYSIEGLPPTMIGVFSTGSSFTMTNEFDQRFSFFYISTTSGQKYIAYNSTKLLQSPTIGVSIVNTFSPPLDMNKLMLYNIEEVMMSDGTKATVKFVNKKNQSTWALGSNYEDIKIEYELDFSNIGDYQVSIDNLNESFTLSNNMPLKSHYVIGEKTYELARYIIKPPSNMRIKYATEIARENIIIEEDGFNKLYYSNVSNIVSVSIGSNQLDKKEYSLMEEAGIIAWKDRDKYVGKTAAVVYEYKSPRSLEFKDLSYLYEMVGYSIDAYEQINSKPVIIERVKDGETKTVRINGKTPDRMVVKCLNINFQAFVNKNKVSVQKRTTASSVLVHTGFYYDDEKEFYMFEHDRNEIVDCYENIEIKRARKVGNTVRTQQRSSNYVKDSVMNNGKQLEETCNINFVEDKSRIGNIPVLGAITACDSYQLWNSKNMEIAIVKGLNGNELSFKNEKDKKGYSYFDITKYVKKNKTISFYVKGEIEAYIAEEILADTDSMQRSVHADIVGEFYKYGDFLLYDFKNVDEDIRYYLVVRGDGVIDDIFIEDTVDKKEVETIHKKMINKIGFNISERATKNYEAKLYFNRDKNTYDGLEIDGDNKIQIGATADYGITLVENLESSFDKCSVNKVTLRKNVFYTASEAGEITTPWIGLPNFKNAISAYIKINDIMIDPFVLFNIRVFAAENIHGKNSREIFYGKKTNLAAIHSMSFLRYLQIVIEMPQKRVINNIEVYARYAENEEVFRIAQRQKGELITGVYDTAVIGNFKPKYITGEITHPESISISVRACRESSEHMVWTEWYPCNMNKHMTFGKDTHVFENYRYFQFKINITNQDAAIKIKEFVLEVI